MTGAYILEIPGGTKEEREAKAEALAGKLEAVFRGNEGIKVARPLKMAQIRIRDLDESIDQEDIVQAIMGVGGGSPQNIKVGRTATAPNGMRAVVVQCPLAVANRVVGCGRITVGWAAYRVSIMEARSDVLDVWSWATYSRNARVRWIAAPAVIGVDRKGILPRIAGRTRSAWCASRRVARQITGLGPNVGPNLRKGEERGLGPRN